MKHLVPLVLVGALVLSAVPAFATVCTPAPPAVTQCATVFLASDGKSAEGDNYAVTSGYGELDLITSGGEDADNCQMDPKAPESYGCRTTAVVDVGGTVCSIATARTITALGTATEAIAGGFC